MSKNIIESSMFSSQPLPSDIRWPGREITDVRYMPCYNPSVENGSDSVSRGLVELRRVERLSITTNPLQCTLPHIVGTYPYCTKHGAMNKVSADGIWRCLNLACDVACYEIKPKSRTNNAVDILKPSHT